MKQYDITIDEHGYCGEAGYGGFGRYGDGALGTTIMLHDADWREIECEITGVANRIHTRGSGGSNYVWATAHSHA